MILKIIIDIVLVYVGIIAGGWFAEHSKWKAKPQIPDYIAFPTALLIFSLFVVLGMIIWL